MEAGLFKSARILTLMLFVASTVLADGVRFWKADSRNDFLSGETEGISILPDESLALAPEVKTFSETGVHFIWAMAEDGRGGIYLASGHDGLVLHLDAAGDTSVVYDALEPEVMALAVAPNGDLFVGASPEGCVYRLPGGKGPAENYFDPDEKYIWKILPGPDGALYVSTGYKGTVYKVTGPQQGKAILRSEETHIIALTFDRNGNLLAGSSGSALLYEVDKSGRVFDRIRQPAQ